MVWDNLNKAAIIVTLITGIPAFLTFAGLPTIAGVILGTSSIFTLSLALYRISKLRNSATTLNDFLSKEGDLLNAFKSTVAYNIDDRNGDITNIGSSWIKYLINLSNYISNNENEKYVLTIWLLEFSEADKSLMAKRYITTASSMNNDKVLSITDDKQFKSIWKMIEDNLPNIAWPKSQRSMNDNALFTKAIIPLAGTINEQFGEYSVVAFITVDSSSRKCIPKKYEATFARVADLYLIMFMDLHIRMELLKEKTVT